MRKYNKKCKCGHKFEEHHATHSHNYTAGRCCKCKCQYFLQLNSKSEIRKDIKEMERQICRLREYINNLKLAHNL